MLRGWLKDKRRSTRHGKWPHESVHRSQPGKLRFYNSDALTATAYVHGMRFSSKIFHGHQNTSEALIISFVNIFRACSYIIRYKPYRADQAYLNKCKTKLGQCYIRDRNEHTWKIRNYNLDHTPLNLSKSDTYIIKMTRISSLVQA